MLKRHQVLAVALLLIYACSRPVSQARAELKGDEPPGGIDVTDTSIWFRLYLNFPPRPSEHCWMDHPVKPIDERLILVASQTPGGPEKEILRLNFNDPRNRAGEIFYIRYSDVPFSRPFFVRLVGQNSEGTAHYMFTYNFAGNPWFRVNLCGQEAHPDGSKLHWSKIQY